MRIAGLDLESIPVFLYTHGMPQHRNFWSSLPTCGFSGFILTFALLVCLPCLGAEKDQQPNILFLFADDQAYETIRHHGFTDIDTPHLDRLAQHGVSFSHAYNMGSWSGAVCLASRTMLNTGRFLWHAQAVYDDTELERQSGRFWSEYLKKAGYRTYFTGKWHVKVDANKAFDVARNIRGGMPNQTPEGYNRPRPGEPDPWSPFDPTFEGFWKGGKHWSEVVADDAEYFLRQAKDDTKPFFMYVAFNAPHDPRQAPRRFVSQYPLDRVEVPHNYLPEYPFKDDIGCGPSLRDEFLGPFPRTDHSVKVNRQEYYAIISHMDEQIGRILDTLSETGQLENTYIFFTADHGLAVGHHGFFGKQNLYDHSVRVPFIVVGPGIEKNGSRSTPVYLQDIMPTTLELAGISKPDHVQFNSILPLLQDREHPGFYNSIYGAYLGLQRSVIKDDYKLILYPKINQFRLYHLKNDPMEMHDLAGNISLQKVRKDLLKALLELQQETGDSLDIQSIFKGI